MHDLYPLILRVRLNTGQCTYTAMQIHIHIYYLCSAVTRQRQPLLFKFDKNCYMAGAAPEE